MASLVAQLVKNPPAMHETPGRSLGREDPPEKGQTIHSSILGLRCGSAGKESSQGAWVRSLGWDDPLEKGAGQYSGLEKSMDYIVHVVAKSRT